MCDEGRVRWMRWRHGMDAMDFMDDFKIETTVEDYEDLFMTECLTRFTTFRGYCWFLSM